MKKLALLITGLFFTPAEHAADLLQAYREAMSSDPVYASARYTRDAGLENLPQGRAGLLPIVNATASTQENRYLESLPPQTAIPELGIPAFSGGYQPLAGNNWGYHITLTQPLFNWQNYVVYKEAGFKVAQAEAIFGQTAQDLVVRVAQAYFDVLASQD